MLVEGIPFPESEGELRNFVDKFPDVNDVQGSLVGIAVADELAMDRPDAQRPFEPARLAIAPESAS